MTPELLKMLQAVGAHRYAVRHGVVYAHLNDGRLIDFTMPQQNTSFHGWAMLSVGDEVPPVSEAPSSSRYELHECFQEPNDNIIERTSDVTPSAEAHVFWTVYRINDRGFADAIADFTEEADARVTLRAFQSQLYTEDEAFAACCVWEWMLERNQRDDSDLGQLWSRSGAVSMRGLACDIGKYADRAWAKFNSDGAYDNCFDWEYIPAVLERLDFRSGVGEAEVFAAAREVITNNVLPVEET